jgi:hypothetical protein
MFRAFIGPSSGVSQAVYMLPFGSYSVCWSSVCACKLVWVVGFTVLHKPVRRRTQTINKHCMNQMVAYKQQLEIPLMTGLWRPETCRVIREIWNKDIKQKSHLLVILIVTPRSYLSPRKKTLLRPKCFTFPLIKVTTCLYNAKALLPRSNPKIKTC